MFPRIQFCKRAWVGTVGVTLLVVVLGVMRVNAQGGTATISGTVTDPSGGAIAAAKVDVKNTGTGIVQSTTTDAQGRYNVPELTIGTYEVQASSSGFTTVVQSGINLTVGAHPLVDIALKVGQTQQTVTVEGQVAQVETSSTALSTLVEPTQMREMPLNGRNFEQLLTLAPGVVQQNGGQTFFGTQSNYSVSGSRPEGQSFLLDSTDIQNFWNHGTGSGATGTSLGIEAIAEFQTLTNTYSAQYGGNGAVINAVTRSGTNSFHGSAYEFFRNSALDARNYFDPASIPPFRRNQFGASLGGPLQKDKAFFFLNYEGLRQLFATGATALVPDAAAHQGYLPTGPGGALQPVNPVGGACTAVYAPTSNCVPASVAPTLALYPVAAGKSTGGIGSFIEVGNQVASENYGIARADYNFSDKDSAFVRYGIDRANIVQPFTSSIIPQWPETDTTSNQYATIEEKHLFSANVINLALFSFVRTIETQTVTGNTPALNFFPGTSRENGQVQVTGLSSIGANVLDPSVELQNKFIVEDDVVWSHGAHSLTFGGMIERIQDNTNGPFQQGGVWTFTSLSGFLQAKPTQIVGALPGFADAHGYLREFVVTPYFQDSWRISQRLTLNLGLRYSPTTNPSEVHHPMETLTTVPLGANGTVNPGPFNFVVVPDAFATNPSLKNIDPRFGFAWDPFNDHKTSVRGGFGMFHDLVMARTILPGYWLNPPYTLGIQLNPTYPNAFATGATPSAVSQQQGIYYNTNHTPYQMQWNLNVQREIAGDTVLTLGYVGSRGVHLFLIRDVNPNRNTGTPQNPVFATLNPVTQAIVPNPTICSCSNISFLFEKGPWAVSNYNSLQASLNHRFSHNLQFQAAYTYSKSLDNGSLTYGLEGTNATLQQLENPYNSGAIDYGRSTFDRTHNFHASALYDLPFHGNKFVEGWQLSSILAATSGPPFSVVNGFNAAGQNGYAVGSRPNLAAGCSPNPIVGKVTEWYNPTCFSAPAVGHLGNLGRDTLVGPGFTNWDFALVKNTAVPKVSEQFAVQFRAEFFDILNHPNFNIPQLPAVSSGTNPPQVFTRTPQGVVGLNPTAGQILSTSGNEVVGGAQRVIQFGLKVLF